MVNVKRMDDYRPSLEVVGGRVADLDDGYTRIANELIEAVISTNLTARQLKIFFALVRKTYGFGKKMDRITNTQIASMTGLHHTHVCTAKNEMIAMKIIVSSGNQIGINKVFSEWNTDISQLSKTLANSANKTLANSANKTLAKTANGHSPTQLNTKETIQNKKEIPPNPLPEVSEECVKPKRRKPNPISCTAAMVIYNELVGDRLPHATDDTPERTKKLKSLVARLATPTLEGFRAYVKAFVNSARPFYFGENDRGWVADFDYLLKPKVLTNIREGKL